MIAKTESLKDVVPGNNNLFSEFYSVSQQCNYWYNQDCLMDKVNQWNHIEQPKNILFDQNQYALLDNSCVY